MATNNIVTESYLAANFTPKAGVTPGTDNVTGLDCDQITARYSVIISGISTTGVRLPSQLELTRLFIAGESYGGGIVGYVLVPGDPGYISGENHGLVIYSGDLGQAYWANVEEVVSGAQGTAIGTGSGNCSAIVAKYPTATTIAARKCTNLGTGWFLPSKDELYKLYLNYVAGNLSSWFGTDYYWSSSEDSTNELRAWAISFADGTVQINRKASNNDRVVAIKYF